MAAPDNTPGWGSLDAKTLVHVATELLVVGGISYYFNRRIGELDQQVKKLKEENEMMGKVLEKHDQVLGMLLNRNQPLPSSSHSPSPTRRNLSDEEMDEILQQEKKALKSKTSKEKHGEE